MSYIGQAPTNVPLTSADIEDGTIALADLSATGTKDATTFLRGDNTFATVTSPDYVKLASGSFSSNSLSFDGYFTSDYSHYKIILTDVIPSANNLSVAIRYRQSNADVTTSHYNTIGNWGSLLIGSGTSNGTSHSENGSSMNLHQGYAVSNVSAACLNSELTIFNPLNTSLYKHFHYSSTLFYSGTTSGATGRWIKVEGGGYYHNNTTALSGFTIFADSGNVTSGNAYLYGVKV